MYRFYKSVSACVCGFVRSNFYLHFYFRTPEKRPQDRVSLACPSTSIHHASNSIRMGGKNGKRGKTRRKYTHANSAIKGYELRITSLPSISNTFLSPFFYSHTHVPGSGTSRYIISCVVFGFIVRV